MKIIEKIIRAMQDTGLIDGMSMEDCDTLATAALEGMREPTRDMKVNGAIASSSTPDEVRPSTALVIYTEMIDAALNE